jgi:hypothetical protein
MTPHGKPGLSEHEVQAQILDWLKAKKIFHWRSNSGAMAGDHKGKRWYVKFGPKGGPDIFAMLPGHEIFGIEVKSEKGFQSQVQKEFEVEFVRAGGQYILAFSLDDAIRGINGR